MRKLLCVFVSVVLFFASDVIAGPLADLPPYTPDANADRDDVPDVYKWKLEHLYPSDDAWSLAFETAREELGELVDLHGSLQDPANLAAYLDGYFRLELEINRLKLYAYLQEITDTVNQQYIARHRMALGLTNDIMEEGSIMRQAILDLSEDDLKKAFGEDPDLERFRPVIDGLHRRSDRILNPEAERVLTLAGDNLWAAIDINELPAPVEQAFAALRSELPLPAITDEDGNEVELTLANYVNFRRSTDRRVRRDAVAGLFGTLRDFENSFAATLGGQAKFSVFLANARNYETALEAYLDKDELDPEVYFNLISTVRAHAPALHRYVELRKAVMGLDEIHLYDLYVPLVEGVDREIPYAEGAKMILTSIEPLGEEYRNLVSELLDPATGCVDVYPSKNKADSASSNSVYGVHPFIRMNYQNRYNDVSILTHELGHAVHTQLSNTHQPYLSSRYVMFLAEVASTCNEILLSRYAVENASSQSERVWLLAELAERIRQVIHRQTMFAEFELRLHELAEAGEPITAERLNSIYGGLLRDYYGPGYTIDPDDVVEWAYIPHFYYKYYVFVYATGMSSGIALAERVLDGRPEEVEAYLGMLRAGNSKPPLELLKEAGADLTKPDAIEAAMKLFDEIVTELEELLVEKG